MQHPYCYPGTDIYRNKWNIRDGGMLASLERLETLTRRENLPRHLPITVTGFKRIHHHIFRNIYDWAGKYRYVDTGRAGSPFCRADFIAGEMDKRFAFILAENRLHGLSVAQFAARAAEHVSELNAIHPFLDGNGRTLRGFLDVLAEQAGHEIDLTRVDPLQWNRASAVSFQRSDYGPMQVVIEAAIV